MQGYGTDEKLRRKERNKKIACVTGIAFGLAVAAAEAAAIFAQVTQGGDSIGLVNLMADKFNLAINNPILIDGAIMFAAGEAGALGGSLYPRKSKKPKTIAERYLKFNRR